MALKTSGTKYKIALPQAKLKINAQTVCISTLTTACKVRHCDALKIMTKKESLKHLKKEPMEKHSVLTRERGEKLYKLYSTLPSDMLGSTIKVHQCLF